MIDQPSWRMFLKYSFIILGQPSYIHVHAKETKGRKNDDIEKTRATYCHINTDNKQ